MLPNEAWEYVFKKRNRLVQFARKVDLYEYQKHPSNEIIRGVLENTGLTIPIQWSRQSGKTEAVVGTVAFLMIFYHELCRKFDLPKTNEFNIGIFAPRLEQAKTDFDRLKEYKRVFEYYGLEMVEANGNTIRLNNKTSCFCFTASPTSSPESKTLNLIILEEAQGLLDFKIENAILPMGSNTNATVVYIGTAGYRRCKFYTHIQQRQSFVYNHEGVIMEKRKRYEDDQNPIHLNYEKYVEEQKREITEDAFKTQYALEWVLERGQYITYERLTSLFKTYEIPESMGKTQTCYAGIDWGKGVDSTVLTIINFECQVIYWREWLGDDYTNQVMDVMRLLQNKFKGVRVIYSDSSATQDQVNDFFERILISNGVTTQVFRVNFSTMKDFMVKAADGLMRDVLITPDTTQPPKLQLPEAWQGPEKERFIRQMVDLQKDIRPNGQWDVRAPEGRDYHDDMPMSLFLACLAFARSGEEYTPMIA